MLHDPILLLILCSPALYVLTALASRLDSKAGLSSLITLAALSGLLNIFITGIAAFRIVQSGSLESGLLGLHGIGFSIRLDSLSLIMLSMISLLSFIIVKFSLNYLDGDKRQGIFIGRISATIASVQLLVLSGNLGLLIVSWILTSISLHRLLIFYPERREAQIAARKKFILARLGDVCILLAGVLLYSEFNSGSFEVLFSGIKRQMSVGDVSGKVQLSAVFLAISAILKSAQFPTHGWLIEVMETPTPVSALLHAGLLNAGPFLILRMAYVVQTSSTVSILLVVVGGFTALFASLAYLTQNSIKTSLAYSSVGHMGFSLLVCGLGLYAAAMLHLVAHSFYKAHAFLSSGSTVDIVRSAKVKPVEQNTSPRTMLLGTVLACLTYTVLAFLWGISPEKDLPLFLIGAVLILGVTRLFVTAISFGWNGKLIVRTSMMAFLVTGAFFTLESGMSTLLSAQIPPITLPGTVQIGLLFWLLILFSLATFVQMNAPRWLTNPHFQAFCVHLRNGFYANALFDRLILAWNTTSPRKIHKKLVEGSPGKTFEPQPLKEYTEQFA